MTEQIKKTGTNGQDVANGQLAKRGQKWKIVTGGAKGAEIFTVGTLPLFPHSYSPTLAMSLRHAEMNLRHTELSLPDCQIVHEPLPYST